VLVVFVFLQKVRATLIPLLRRDGLSDADVDRVFSTFNVARFAAERSQQ